MLDLRSVVIGLVLMLKKYTCVNLTIYEEANEEDYKNGIMLLPLIGLAMGFAAFIIGSFRYVYDGFFISSVLLLYYCLVTKTTTIKDVYRTLNFYIKPSNQTENLSGILGTVLVLFMYFSLFRLVPLTSLIIMPAAGFSSLMIVGGVIKRDSENTAILKYCGKYHITAAFATPFFFAALFNYKLIISLSLTFMAIAAGAGILDKRVKNAPSSVEGFIIEISQIIFLIITYLIRLG
jgi:cobalamin synthase